MLITRSELLSQIATVPTLTAVTLATNEQETLADWLGLNDVRGDCGLGYTQVRPATDQSKGTCINTTTLWKRRQARALPPLFVVAVLLWLFGPRADG